MTSCVMRNALKLTYGHPEVKKNSRGYAPWRGGKAGRKGKVGPPNFKTVVAPLGVSAHTSIGGALKR